MVNINILIVDDEKLIVKGLKRSLEQQGYKVFTAYTGNEALNIVKNENIDFIILDLMLPDIDGMIVCKRIRQNYDMPILMLSAKDGDYDKILGFEFGADDYMTKPFNTLELIARIKAISKRVNNKDSEKKIVFKDLEINLTKEKSIGSKEVELTQKSLMLYLMAKNPDRVY